MSSGEQPPVVPSLLGSRVIVANNLRHNAFGGAVRLGLPGSGDLYGCYRNGAAHSSLDCNIAFQTSTDGGATWSANAVLHDEAVELRDVGIARLSTGVLIVSFAKVDGAGDYSTWTIRSTDDGATWDTPVEVPLFSAYTFASAPVVELGNGDLLLPAYGSDSAVSPEWYSKVARSTDGGDTWTSLATIATSPTIEFVEPNIVLLDNGDLLCMMRTDVPDFTFYRSTSTDNGVTWSAAVAVFGGASGRPAVFQTPRGAVLCMYRAQTPDAVPGRSLYRASWDRGATWSDAAVLLQAGGSYVYGQFVLMDTALVDGNVGIFWSNEYASNDADVYWQLLADDAEAPA